MKGPMLFLCLETVNLLQLPSSVGLRRRKADGGAVGELCCSGSDKSLAVLWSGVSTHPTWHPEQGAFDGPTIRALDALNHQLEVLNRTLGMSLGFGALANAPVMGDDSPAHWLNAGAHPLNLHATPLSRPFAVGDTLIICEWSFIQRKELPGDKAIFHGNRVSGKKLEDATIQHLQWDDEIPHRVCFSVVNLYEWS